MDYFICFCDVSLLLTIQNYTQFEKCNSFCVKNMLKQQFFNFNNDICLTFNILNRHLAVSVLLQTCENKRIAIYL